MKLVQKIVIIIGLLLMACSIMSGICIVIFSFKFLGGGWMTFGRYLLTVLGLGLGGMFIGFLGITTIHTSRELYKDNKDGQQIDK